jgi:hypothetical protein
MLHTFLTFHPSVTESSNVNPVKMAAVRTVHWHWPEEQETIRAYPEIINGGQYNNYGNFKIVISLIQILNVTALLHRHFEYNTGSIRPFFLDLVQFSSSIIYVLI